MKIEGIELGKEYPLHLIEGDSIEVEVLSVDVQWHGKTHITSATVPFPIDDTPDWHPDAAKFEPKANTREIQPYDATVRVKIVASHNISLPGMIMEMDAETFHGLVLDAEVNR